MACSKNLAHGIGKPEGDRLPVAVDAGIEVELGEA